ncbi:MAG TPA: DNA translocase FtsK 4TM domain-containing protein [Alphaproteobacteria bacterium]|nr:DNA translocase FtsK 4TM domain-containing protein [Alphaproteobacteria bacterium]
MAGSITRRPSGQKASPRRPARRGYADRLREGLGVLLAVGAVYLLLCLHTYMPTDPSLNHAAPDMVVQNLGGRLGAYTADTLIMLFGLGAFMWVGWLVYHAVNMLFHREGPSINLQVVTVPLLLVSTGALLSLTSPLPDWPVGGGGFGNGGLLGKLVATLVVPLLGHVGALMLMAALAVLALLWFTGWSLREVHATAIWIYKVAKVFATMTMRLAQRLKFKVPEQFDLPLSHPIPRRPTARVIRTEEADDEAEAKPARPAKQAELDLSVPGQFVLPSLDLLDEPKEQKDGESEEALQQNARRIEAELKNFGVEGVVSNIRPGPVITIYELEPAAGVKTSTIVGLQDDLARAMSALSIRIAPIPGRNVLGIELPNRERQFTSLRELLETETFEEDPGALTVALGVDTSGQPTYADISKMPHGLIAGTTGSGKSVGINAFILSLVFRLTPDELKLVMVDPKMLELSIYNDIPHLITPVITDPNKAAAALNWVVKEMENRYRLMAELGVKNLASFNTRFAELQADGRVPTRLVQTGFDLQTGQPVHEEQPLATKPLPYIVVIIDELADLMMVAGKAVEFSIARLTQMARASGIHLLVATQRPSVDVVTGLIKANIPVRMSFAVASKIDSRTVLDSMGAETLLGKGDMLYLGNGSNALQRLHGAFVSEEECTRVAEHLREQGAPSYMEDIFKSGPATIPGSKGAAGGEDGEDNGDLYQQAVEVVTREGKASTSFLQRHLKIGYNRAADLIDKMEGEGIIGAPNHVGKREVLGKKVA